MARTRLDQDRARLRAGDYPAIGDQLDALWKIIDAILPHLPPEALDAIPRDALAELERVAGVKARFPRL